MQKTPTAIRFFSARRILKGDLIPSLVLLLPSFALLTVFIAAPLGYSLVMSLFDTPARNELVFVGFNTYGHVLGDPAFWKALLIGGRYALVIVPSQIIIAFLLASLATKLRRRFGAFFKVAVYIPCVLSGVVVGVIFLSVFQEDTGVFNAILSALWKPFALAGAKPFTPIAWLSDPSVDWLACSVAVVWAGLGYTTLIMLGGLYDIPVDYYEAATIDGAGKLAKLFHITLPGLKNVFVYVLVSLIVSSVQVFEIPYIMTGKGQIGTTMGPIGFLFDKFNYDINKTYATVASIVIAIILALLSSIIFRVISSEKSEA
ncbi:MAG: sugar ABC transporter permease [Clostridiales bacterium]|nr:sugar ABC transporter permease [Clostridiales bacterium]